MVQNGMILRLTKEQDRSHICKGRYSSVANNYLYFDKPRQKLISWNDWFGSPMYAQEAERMMQSANNNNSSMQNNSNGFDIF